MLFRAALRSLGLSHHQFTGPRGSAELAIDAPRPAIHMLLRVELPEGPYLADVGFGNLAPNLRAFAESHWLSRRRRTR